MADDKGDDISCGDDNSWDWRKSNHLNPIRHQKNGNCCFAFCVCCVLEAVHHIEKKGKGELIHLSPQDIYNNLIKNEEENEDGRTVADTIEWVRENGCVLETSCPYVGTFKQAAKERNKYLSFVSSLQIELTKDLGFKKEDQKVRGKLLESKIREAPVAAQMLWFNEMNSLKGYDIYSGPKDAKDLKMKEEEKKEEYHAVTIVGYGQEMREIEVENENKRKKKKKMKLIKYWIIRNSHGLDWGEKGYVRINRAPCHDGRLLIDVAWALGGVYEY